MVVDEELKMMCTVGDMGGVVVGPRLKEMAHLAHTEYELRGRSSLDVREVLRETMFAATVTGSPVQNACRVIERHEVGGRGYYAGALALIGTRLGRRADPRLPHPDPYRRHRRRRDAAGTGRRDAGAALGPGGRGRRDARQGGRCAGRAGGAPRTAAGARRAAAARRRPAGAGGAGRPPGGPGAVLAADAGARRRADRPRAGGRRRGHLHRDAGASAAVDRSGGDGPALRRAGAAGGGGCAPGPGGAGPGSRAIRRTRPIRRCASCGR